MQIDYNLLEVGILPSEIKAACEKAALAYAAAVLVPPCYLELAVDILKESPTHASTIIGCTSGMSIFPIKMAEAIMMADAGAQELDWVANIAILRGGAKNVLLEDISNFVNLIRKKEVLSKVFIESVVLSLDEVKIMCEICTQADVDFVSAAVDLSKMGQELEKLRLIRSILPKKIRIKAVGEIESKAQIDLLAQAGVDRIETKTIITK